MGRASLLAFVCAHLSPTSRGMVRANRTRGTVPSCVRGLYRYACVGVGLLGSVPGGGFGVCVFLALDSTRPGRVQIFPVPCAR